MKLLLGLVAAAARAVMAAADANFCGPNNEFCMSVVMNPADLTTVIVTLSSSTYNGWLGLGLAGPNGQQMDGSRLYFVYNDAANNNAPTVLPASSQRHSPSSIPNRDAKDGVVVPTPQGVTLAPNSVLTISFTRPIGVADAGDPGLAADTKFFYAASTDTLSGTDPAGSSFQGHSSDFAVPDPILANFNFKAAPDGNSSATSPGPVGAAPSSSAAASSTSSPRSSSSSSSTAVATPSGSANTGVQNDGASNSKYCTDKFCVNALKAAGSQTITFAVSTTTTGWFGLGVGSDKMAGSTFYIAYSNKTGGVTLSQRSSGSGHSSPSFMANPGFVQAPFPASVTPIAGATMQFAFTRPATDSSAASVSLSGATNCVWGINSAPPSDVNSPSSSISQHSSFGSFTLDVSKAGNTTGTTTAPQFDPTTMKLIHGSCMFIAWGVIPYVAIYIARYLKDRLGHMWYLLHRGLFLVGVGGLTVVGLIAIELEVVVTPRFIGSMHGIMGTVLAFVLLPVQIGLGFAANQLWTPNRPRVPIFPDIIHQYIGRSSTLFSVVIMYYGLQLFGAGALAYVGMFFWIGTMLVIHLGGQFAGGQINHVAEEVENIELMKTAPK